MLKKISSLILAFVMLICMTPLTIFAAPASDIPADMLDNVYLDALEYTGYNVFAKGMNVEQIMSHILIIIVSQTGLFINNGF